MNQLGVILGSGAGPFKIIEVLGEGSFGTVVVATLRSDPEQRTCALKVLKGEYVSNPKIMTRTRDEARILSRIDHPNIVHVERLVEVGGRPVVVMEHVKGLSLEQLLHRMRDGLPVSVALEIARLMCVALHCAHFETLDEKGRALRVIHRDIKSSNLLLSVDGEVKVVDFGIARGEFEGREAKTQSVVMGSRPYMAPERLDGVEDDDSVDVYSAGMCLFELLTGHTMTLSINPINHDAAMTSQLETIRFEGASEETLGDLRLLLSSMCAYDRDHRPSAKTAAGSLQRLLHTIALEERLSLPDFAQSSVKPLYEARQIVKPEDTLEGDLKSNPSLFDITSQLTSGRSLGAKQPPKSVMIFAGAVGILLFLTLVAAGVKYFNLSLSEGGQSDGNVTVTFLIPAEASAIVGAVEVAKTSQIRVPPGPTLVQLELVGGGQAQCTFVAKEGAVVRYGVDAGRVVLVIDDLDTKPCTVL